MSTLERVLLHAHTVDVGVDDKRRTFPLPREGLQPCVAPYFATRGRGDMRGPPMGIPQIAPRRRCEAVRSRGGRPRRLGGSAALQRGGSEVAALLCSAMPISPIRPIGPIPAILPPPGCVNFRLTRRFWRDLRAHHIRPPYLCCRDAPRGQGRMPGSRCIYNTVIG